MFSHKTHFAGWAAAWFELLAVVLELIMNTKLIYIARHTVRGGTVHRLKPTIFWFGASGPWYCPAPAAAALPLDCWQNQHFTWDLEHSLSSVWLFCCLSSLHCVFSKEGSARGSLHVTECLNMCDTLRCVMPECGVQGDAAGHQDIAVFWSHSFSPASSFLLSSLGPGPASLLPQA